MRFSDVEVRGVYHVRFDDVRTGEFNGTHLSIVLKKNADAQTVIVAPLTSSSRGEGTSKINIGKLECLPKNLSGTDSYHVYDQTRTVNVNRMSALKGQDGERILSIVSPPIFYQVLAYCCNEVTKSLNDEEKLNFTYHEYSLIALNRMVNLAYNIKKAKSKSPEDSVEVAHWAEEISLLAKRVPMYEQYINKLDVANGILMIIKGISTVQSPSIDEEKIS